MNARPASAIRRNAIAALVAVACLVALPLGGASAQQQQRQRQPAQPPARSAPATPPAPAAPANPLSPETSARQLKIITNFPELVRQKERQTVR